MTVGITACTLENYSNFKNTFLILFNSDSILEKNNYCNNRSRWKL